MERFNGMTKEELAELLMEVTVALQAFRAVGKMLQVQIESPRGVTETAKGTLKSVLDTVENNILPLVT